MHARRLAVTALVVLTSAIALTQVATYDLSWKPKEAQAFSYKLSMRTVVESAPLNMTGDLMLKVLKVAANGDYTIESRFKNGKVSYKGVDEAMEGGDDAEVQTFSAKGVLLTPEKEDPTDDPLGYVLGQIADFTPPDKPVKVGDKWEKAIKAKPKSVPARSEFELVGRQKIGDVDTLKVKYSYRQTEGSAPVSADGSFNIDPTDGMMVVFEANITNLPFDKNLPPTVARLRLERAK